MKKLIIATLLVGAIGSLQTLRATDIENVSSGAVKPGEWNSNYSASRKYAEDNKLPLLILWSNPGCAMCNKMKTACNTGTFATWRQSKNIVFIISEGDGTSKSFAKGNNSSGKFPYMRLYWPAGNVDMSFSGRAGMIPGSNKSEALEQQLMKFVDSKIGNNPNPGPNPDPDPTPVIGDEWNKSRKLYGSFYDANGDLAGRVIVSAGKVNKKKGTSKVKVQILNMEGKTKTLGSENFTVDKTTKGSVSASVGGATISITGNTISGDLTYNDAKYKVKSIQTGGEIADGKLSFCLLSYPTICDGNPVIEGEKYLPINQKFDSKSSRWTFAKKGTLKRNSKTGEFVMSASDNPSGLKLSYKSSTGFFKGTFTVFARKGEKTIKKYTAKVTGFVAANDDSHGQVVIKKVGTYGCEIKPAE